MLTRHRLRSLHSTAEETQTLTITGARVATALGASPV
jgi:hypothetical protein